MERRAENVKLEEQFSDLSSPLCSKLMVGRVITVNNTTRSF